MTQPRRRHDLVRLTRAGWARLASERPQHHALVERWSMHDRPLVVARRRPECPPERFDAGLPAPLADGRTRIAIEVADDEVASCAMFPALVVVASVPSAIRHALDDRCVRVYGAHGWQALTGEHYVHARSDVDLLVEVDDEPDADAVVERLAALAASTAVVVDGELAFADGHDIAWREWRRHRAGDAARVLVKRIDTVFLA